MNDLETLTASFGLLKREFRDAHAVLSRLDAGMATAHRAQPSPRDLLARVIACHVTGRHKTRAAAAVAAEHYGNDAAVLKALASPGRIGKSTWPSLPTPR